MGGAPVSVFWTLDLAVRTLALGVVLHCVLGHKTKDAFSFDEKSGNVQQRMEQHFLEFPEKMKTLRDTETTFSPFFG